MVWSNHENRICYGIVPRDMCIMQNPGIFARIKDVEAVFNINGPRRNFPQDYNFHQHAEDLSMKLSPNGHSMA